MKLIFFNLLFIISSFSMGQKNTKELILGKWILNDSIDKGDLEFTAKNIFTMRFFLDEYVTDTVILTGKYTCNSTILFLKVEKEPAFEYSIDLINENFLTIRYNETVSKYIRKEK